jgi:hypothetical protein
MMLLVMHFLGLAPARPAMADAAYQAAMRESGDLLDRMRGRSSEPVDAVICEVWRRREDLPFLSEVFEAAQEAGTPKALP